MQKLSSKQMRDERLNKSKKPLSDAELKFKQEKEYRKEKQASKERLTRQRRIFEIQVKQKGGRPEEVEILMLEHNLQEARKLAELSKQQLAEQFQSFDEVVVAQTEDLLELTTTVPAGVTMPESFNTEIQRLTELVNGFKSRRDELQKQYDQVDTDNPVVANTELLQIGMDLNSMQVELGVSLLPAALDLSNIASAELNKL